MSAAILEPQIFDELKAALNHGVESGELLTPLQIEQQTALFRDRFGPAVLRDLDGEALLKRSTQNLQRSTRRPADYAIYASNSDHSRHESELTRCAIRVTSAMSTYPPPTAVSFDASGISTNPV